MGFARLSASHTDKPTLDSARLSVYRFIGAGHPWALPVYRFIGVATPSARPRARQAINAFPWLQDSVCFKSTSLSLAPTKTHENFVSNTSSPRSTTLGTGLSSWWFVRRWQLRPLGWSIDFSVSVGSKSVVVPICSTLPYTTLRKIYVQREAIKEILSCFAQLQRRYS